MVNVRKSQDRSHLLEPEKELTATQGDAGPQKPGASAV